MDEQIHQVPIQVVDMSQTFHTLVTQADMTDKKTIQKQYKVFDYALTQQQKSKTKV